MYHDMFLSKIFLSVKERGETGLVEFELEIPEDEQELEQLLAEENDKIQMFRAAANSTINGKCCVVNNI